MIKRRLTKTLTDRLFKRKAVVLIGARQVGKTTLDEFSTCKDFLQVTRNCFFKI